MSENTTVVPSSVILSDTALGAIDSFDAALMLLQDAGVVVESAADYGSGFSVVEKESLVGVPFVIVEWRFNDGKFSEPFVSAECVTKHGDKVVINDGSTGICRQLREIAEQRENAGNPNARMGLVVPNGLTRTDYWFNEDTKETSSKPQTGKGWGPARTYYLAS